MGHVYIDSVLKPKETFAAEKSKSSFGGAVINYAIGGFIMGVIYFVLALTTSLGSGNIMAGVIGGVMFLVGLPIVLVVFSMIAVAIMFIVAKLLGGKGSYTSLFYLDSLYVPVIYLVSMIPIAGFLASIYSIYLSVLAIKESQELSTGRAVVVMLVPVVLAIIVAVIIAAIFVLGTIPAASR